ncbi:beta-ketoacyl synthase N-terminal-like domain-containing protein [Chryseobacterium sp. MYb264]|uniref:type I polyketide synthase n=1 Tax=Chryseobacterium sp. MYb264 TaxID=2745153 RepID=UPI002E109F1C|nr:beta-ketoacyl synthase N-terminal-like domain-containing protein [Chryseobacterium sp. MYb264]
MNTIKKNKIAVIGLDCKFPGESNSPDQFWQTLTDKKDGITPIPPDRWDHSFYYDAKGGKGKTFVDRAGFISGVFDFSPGSFGISEKDAADIDPQQRLLIQSSWNTIQNAGYKIETIKEKTGVFFGMSYRDYYDFDIAPQGVDGFTASNPLGNFNAVAAGRVAYLLGLNGPAIQLDTICSSSLMTLHLACQSLLNEECDYALSGGVNCILSPHALVALAQMGALSRSARCQAFSKNADGYIRGEGVGTLLLKRLEDAERDGDAIYGIVEGTATNHDGRSNGLTAPNGKAQVRLMEACLKKAGLSPSDIGYVEAHGTGTYLGDPVELESLHQVFGASKSLEYPLLVGSVKSNIGHLEPAAGVASLIKSLLILKNKVIPAGLYLEELNPGFKWHEKPILLVKENKRWEAKNARIGVSAFSMTGANVHAILGQAPQRETNEYSPLPNPQKYPFILSAQNESTLNQYVTTLLLSMDEKMPITDLSNTFVNGREIFEQSIFGSFSSTKELLDELKKYKEGTQNTFHQVSLKGKRKQNQVILNIKGITDFNSDHLKAWKKEEALKPLVIKADKILQKLLGKSLEQISEEKSSLLEKKALHFIQVWIWSSHLRSLFQSDFMIKTSGQGDYIGAVLSGIFPVEEALLLFMLENGDKRLQLLDRMTFHPENMDWEKAEEASNKEFWLEKRQNDQQEMNLHILNDDQIFSVSPFEKTEILQDILLECYAKGARIHWSSVLGNKLLRKIALPPAPLAMAAYISESYKINSRKNPDASVHSNSTEKKENINSVLHQQQENDDDHRKAFNSVFSPEKYGFIKDHIVNGHYIFPGSGYISMISEALLYLEKSHLITLKNVQIFQPMSFSSINEEKEVELSVNYDFADLHDSFIKKGGWEIKSKKSQEDWTLHIKGSFGIRRENAAQDHNNLLAYSDETTLKTVEVQAFYDHLSRWGVEYGSEFRLVKQLKADTDHMKAAIEQSPKIERLMAAPNLLDACMHALFSAKTFEQFSEPFVPARYDEITFYQPLPDSINASGLLLTTDQDSMKAQFSFNDTSGKPVMEISSMEIRKILNEFLNSGKETEMIYTEQWKALEINTENTQKKQPVKEQWIFYDVQQAQEAISILVKTDDPVPFVKLIGSHEGLSQEHKLSVFSSISELIKHQKNEEIHFLLFAPPIQDIKGLSEMFSSFKDVLLDIPKNISFSLCTRNGIAVDTEDVNPFHTALWGLARTMPVEARQRWKQVIDISSAEDLSWVSKLKNRSTPDQLAIRNQTVYTPVLLEEALNISKNTRTLSKWENPVLITGGLGQMGRIFTEQLVKLGCKKIHLLSRNPSWFQDKDNSGKISLSDSQKDFLKYAEQCQSKGISIEAIAGKVDCEEDMKAIALLLKNKGIEEINFVHAAGAITRNKVTEADRKELEAEWNAKYEGALQLDQQFADFKVGYTLYTSSIASLWSGDGVAGYSSANLLLDGLATKKNRSGQRTVSVRFGRFSEKGLMKDEEAKELENSGVLTLPMSSAIKKALELTVQSELVIPSIMNIDWKRFAPLYQLLNHNQLLSSVETGAENSREKKSEILHRSADRPLSEIIQEMVAEELEIEIDEVDPDIPLFELGLDSIHSLGIRTDLEELLQIKLSVSLIYDFNTVTLLSRHLEELTQKETDSPSEKNEEESEEKLLKLLMQELQ